MKKTFFRTKAFLRQFSEVLLKLYHVTIFKDLKATLDSKMVVIIIAYCEVVIVFWVQP